MSRRGASSGGGASSLGYLFGSDATTLARPNNRAPPRPQKQQQPSADMTNSSNYASTGDHGSAGAMYDTNRAYNSKPQQQFEHDASGYETPKGYETPTGYHTPSGYHTPGGSDSNGPLDPRSYNGGSRNYNSGSGRPGGAGNAASAPMNYAHQTRAAGKVINDGGGVSLDMSGGSFMGRDNNYFRADGQNSGNFITGRPSTRVQAAPGGGSSLGYLFGGT